MNTTDMNGSYIGVEHALVNVSELALPNLVSQHNVARTEGGPQHRATRLMDL